MSAPWRGKKLSAEHRASIKAGVRRAIEEGKKPGNRSERSPELRARISKTLTGHQVSEEVRIKISDTLIGQIHSPERCARIAAAFTPERRAKLRQNTFDGGETAVVFATVLCSVGFVREHYIWFGNKIDKRGRRNGHAKLDFAHVEGKVDIELDDPRHDSIKQNRHDFERDAMLRSLGWKILRIRI